MRRERAVAPAGRSEMSWEMMHQEEIFNRCE